MLNYNFSSQFSTDEEIKMILNLKIIIKKYYYEQQRNTPQGH